MKKQLCLILSILMSLTTLAPCQSVIAAEMDRRSVSLFSNRVEDLNTEYELDSESFEANFNEDNPNAVEDRLIVKAKDNISDDTALESVKGLEYTVIQYEDKQAMEKAYDELTEKGYSVEKDRILSVKDNKIKNLRTMADSNSRDAEEISDRWSYESVMSDYAKVQIEKSSATENEIVVGVLDSGVDYTHELFEGRIDDTSFNMSASGEENDCMDDNGHGTAVAGIIAQTTPDNVKIRPYKVIDEEGYVTLSEFTAAMEVILASNDLPDIMNISLGGYLFEENMSLETELVSRLVDKGVTVCVASGNDNLPVEYCTPADCEGAITVGAYDYTNHICSFSNYGKEVDVAAPGYNVYSIDLWSGLYYADYCGTSFACPIASAACAYILMQNPRLTPDEVQEQIKSSAIDMGEDEQDYYGCGMLNFPNLLNDKEYTVSEPDIKSGFFTDTQTVTFDNIPADAQLVYTLDKTIPSNTNGTVYSEPITIDNEMQLNYVLIKDGKYASNISSQYYTVQYLADENDFEITDDGIVTAYNGNKNNIIVPDTIKEIVPTQLKRTFEGSSITSAIIPDSVTDFTGYTFANSPELKYVTAKGLTSIGSSFVNCYSLRYIDAQNLKSTAGAGFKNCSMMHEINFENYLEQCGSDTFSHTGLLSVNLPNLKPSKLQQGSMNVFTGCPIIKCNIPQVTAFDNEYFADCYFLQELNIPKATRFGQFMFRECMFLTELDLSNLEWICYNTFSFCYLDTLYAPKLKKVSNSTTSMVQGVAFNAPIRVVDLPALTDVNRLLCSMFVEEIYLENLETMYKNTFSNLPDLKVVYLPKVQTYYRTAVNKLEEHPELGPTEIFWIPQAEWNDSALDIPEETKLLFAPNMTTGRGLHGYDTTFVLSEKAEKVYISPCEKCYKDNPDNIYPTIIAPKGSAAWSQWTYSDEDPMTYIDSDSITTTLGRSIRVHDAGLRFGFSYEKDKIISCINEYENLKKRIDMEYGFVYSLDSESNLKVESVDNKTVYSLPALNRINHGDYTTFNLVLTNIPKSSYNQVVYARAYVNIDGMYFYSNPVNGSFTEVANLVLADDEIDSVTKDRILELTQSQQ